MADFWSNFAEAMGWGKANHTSHLSNMKSQTNVENPTPGVYSERREQYIGSDDIKSKAVKSLRTGEDYAMPTDNLLKNDGETRYTGNKIYSGGIGQGRFLGGGVGDVTNAEYFSNKKASDKFKPLKVTMSRTHQDGDPYVGDFTVKYDDDGAISEIDIETDMNMDYMDDNDRRTGRYRSGEKIVGAGNISDFFKKLGVASEESDFLIGNRNFGSSRENKHVDWYTGPRDEYGQFSRNGIASKDIWAPTAIFGSKGVLNEKGNSYGKWQKSPDVQNNDHWINSWNEVGYGNTRGAGKDAWSRHWGEIRKQMQGENK